MTLKKVTCIIVTYNAMKWIEKCLRTIKEDDILLQVVVIDNNSTDDTVNYIGLHFPNVIILPQNVNLGFSGANNVGYEYSKNFGADYIYLLNQDTISYPNSITSLIKICEKDESIGVASPIHLSRDKSKLDKKFEDYITSGSCPGYISDSTLGQLKEYYPIGFVNAAAWLVKVDAIKSIGGLFSSAFFHYGEDSNFLTRLRFFNKKCVIVPGIFVHHLRDEREGKMSEAFEKKKLSIKKVEIMTDINSSYKKSTNTLFRYAGQQLFKGNFSGAFELFFYPLISMSKIKAIRKSYHSAKII